MTFNQPNDRRDFVKTLGASVATSTVSGFLFNTSAAIAQTNQEIITRKIPRTGESLPAIGLGTYLTVDLLPGAPKTISRRSSSDFGKTAQECLTPHRFMAPERSASVILQAQWLSMNKCSYVTKFGQLVNSYPTTATPNVVSNGVSKDSGEIRSISCRCITLSMLIRLFLFLRIGKRRERFVTLA